MALPTEQSYKMEYTRYRHYFNRLYVFYQKPTIKVSAALLLTLFTIIFFAAFAIRPTLITVAELIKKIEDQQQVLEQMKKKSASLASAQQEYMAAQAYLSKLAAAVPPAEDLPSIITQLEALASKHQLAYNSISLGDVTYSLDSPSTEGVQSRLINLSLAGNYDSLSLYLTELIHLPRAISVESFTFTLPQKSLVNQADLQLNLSLKTYYLNP